jgi:hypothetical protein
MYSGDGSKVPSFITYNNGDQNFSIYSDDKIDIKTYNLAIIIFNSDESVRIGAYTFTITITPSLLNLNAYTPFFEKPLID